jgi:ubiquinone/menaquinone biosynthesis C-methylase UbiE
MTKPRVNYDQIASAYDKRFVHDRTEGIGQALLDLAHRLNAGRILEVGCGTCHWLGQMHRADGKLYGLDLSTAMLDQAREQRTRMGLVNGYARQLPSPSEATRLIWFSVSTRFTISKTREDSFLKQRGFYGQAAPWPW